MDLGVRTERATLPAGAGRAGEPATTSATATATASAAGAGVTGKPASPTGKDLPADAVKSAVRQAVAQVQGYLRANQRELLFQLDEASGRTVIRVVNPESGELIRQIPSEEFLQVAANLERGSLRLIDRLA
jgi:flagellar protein FlaG